MDPQKSNAGSRVYRTKPAAAANWETMSNASLGTAAAFTNPAGTAGLFLPTGDYNAEYLQTFITKPMTARNKAVTKPLRQPVLYSDVQPLSKPRTVIYYKKYDLESDPQKRDKFKLLSKEEQAVVEGSAQVTKGVLFNEARKGRKAWNTPCEKPGSLPKPPPRVSMGERKARIAKAAAELENHGALVETVTVPDDNFGAGKYGKRLHMYPVLPTTGSYNPSNYDTPRDEPNTGGGSPTRSQFGDDDDELEKYTQPVETPLPENATPAELRLLTAARNKQWESSLLRKKVARLEGFVKDIQQGLKSTKAAGSPTRGAAGAVKTESAMRTDIEGTSGPLEVYDIVGNFQAQQDELSGVIEQLRGEKEAAEKRVKAVENELLKRNKAELEGIRLTKERNVKADNADARAKVCHSRELKKGERVEFWTDVEGNFVYFNSLVERSKVVFVKEGEEGESQYRLKDNCSLVFGGDAVDKGIGDIRFVKILVKLKKMYPDRVFLILGNRDINKLRMLTEVADFEGEGADVYWDAKTAKYNDWCVTQGIATKSKVSMCKWMLECTMGCGTTFETRRKELCLLRSLEDEMLVTEEEVVESFVRSVDAKGGDPWMLELIKHGQLMVVLGDCLFVHGGVCENSLGRVPGEEEMVYDIKEWGQRLNQWKNRELKEFVGGGSCRELLDYGLPNGNGGKTVCYNNFMKNGNPKPPDHDVEVYMFDNDVGRIFVGHQPVGDCPAVVRRADLMVVMGDTSYSDMGATKEENPANNRGECGSMITFGESWTEVEGTILSGEKFKYRLSVDESRDSMPECLVGKQLAGDAWVKAVVGGGKVVTAYCEGFKITLDRLEASVALGMCKAAPKSVGGRDKRKGRTKKEGGEVKEKDKGPSFVERQAAMAKKNLEAKRAKEKEAEALRKAEVGGFKGKELEKGKMAKDSKGLQEAEEAARETRERENKVKAVENAHISHAPSRQQMAEQHETEAQRRGRERREKEKEKAERDEQTK